MRKVYQIILTLFQTIMLSMMHFDLGLVDVSISNHLKKQLRLIIIYPHWHHIGIVFQVGVAFTRFQTRYFQGKYGNLDATVVSYGPCQTPTLNFCVERHQAITSFQPEPFWLVRPQVWPSLRVIITPQTLGI